MKAETVTIGRRTYRKFIPYPAAVRDGTVRCIFCGQIDEPEIHEGARCPMSADWSEDAGRAALGQGNG